MSIRRPSSLAAALLIVLGAALPAAAGAARTRPGGGGGGGGHPPHHAQGHATWGHGGYYGHGGHGHGWYGYPAYGYPYYGYPYAGWWGYPYWGVSLGWGYAPYGGYGPAYVEQGGAENVPGQAWVETDVVPKRATVRLDGEEVGYAGDWNGVWDRLPLEPGRHVLEFSAEGHRTLQVHVAAQPGRVYHIRRDLARGEGTDSEAAADPPASPPPQAPPQESAGGYLHLSVEPGDAAVYLDGTFVGRASELRRRSASRPLPPGEHELEVVRPGYLPERRTVVVEPDGVQELRIDLRQEGAEGARVLSSRGSGGSSPA